MFRPEAQKKSLKRLVDRSDLSFCHSPVPARPESTPSLETLPSVITPLPTKIHASLNARTMPTDAPFSSRSVFKKKLVCRSIDRGHMSMQSSYQQGEKSVHHHHHHPHHDHHHLGDGHTLLVGQDRAGPGGGGQRRAWLTAIFLSLTSISCGWMMFECMVVVD
jgi:hypothetical protein